MAKARSRTTARKVKDKWKAKNWYNIVAPPSFDGVTVADTLTENPESLINRVTGVSLQDITNDFRKSHVVLYFKIHNVEENNAHTQFVGHTLTSDYLRRLIRRRRSKIEGVYDVTTKDGAQVRVKPFATTDKRIQNSQKRVVRESMKKTLVNQANKSTMSEFVNSIIDGKIGSDIYKNCKKLYPVKRVEIYKTEVIAQPSVEMADKPKKKKEEKEKTEETKDEKPNKGKKREKKTKEEVKQLRKKEEIKATSKEKNPAEIKEKKELRPKKVGKKETKKTTAKKTTTKKPTKATNKKKTTKKK